MTSPATTPPVYPGGLDRSQVVAWRNAIFIIFGVCGVGLASWMARTPAVKAALGISTGEMGILILSLAVGSIVGLVASSHIIARFGARKIITWCLAIGPLGLILAGFGVSILPNFAIVSAGLLVFGVGMAVCDVAMNLSGAVNERVLGRTIMPVFHAFFSFGTMLGAGIGALAELAGVPIFAQAAVVSAAIIVASMVAVRYLQSENAIEQDTNPDAGHSTWRERLSIWADPRTLTIGLIVLGMALAEGSANDWLALTMVEGHHVDKPSGAVIFGVFVTAMTVGRLAGVSVLDRYGRVPVLRGSAVLAIVGLLMVIYSPVVWIAVVGVVLWGLGSALGFPTGMSAAADDPRTATARVSAVATIGYVAFLVGPPMIGFLGEHFGLLNALLPVLALIIVAGIASGAAREPKKA
ncbi:fucose permease [Homoserinimonas aerilata]|uniref:Fucose permease n=1 Tax=Homoserinimonas aerilata TaxID=1162970 RepID=A0A542XX02_9MICO|nr:MFS transporter [Homoserinimonas aerilata]TQL40364.1 fucose permease [Homoserinimonas aerilata]